MVNHLNWSSWLAEQRATRLNGDLHRNRLVLSGCQGSNCKVEHEELVNFSSNDYLGLAGHPELAECLAESATLFGVGSGASHMVCGHHELHQQLETALASFVGSQRALVFSSGYMANIGLPQVLTGRGDLILSDRLNHASLIDGVRLSHAKTKRFQHRDVNHARRISRSADYQRCLLVTDGVFSMDGDIAPISELRILAAEIHGLLLVDDAHGVGVHGSKGRGSLALDVAAEELVDFNNVLLMGTLGKAFGCFGAFVAGNADLIEHVEQHCRSYIYTTALPPGLAACALTALDMVLEGSLTESLHRNIQFFRNEAEQRSLSILESLSAIQAIVIGDNAKTIELAVKLRAKGYLVGAIRPPTVPDGTARLRITLCATHTSEQISGLLTELTSALGNSL